MVFGLETLDFPLFIEIICIYLRMSSFVEKAKNQIIWYFAHVNIMWKNIDKQIGTCLVLEIVD